MAVQLVDKVEAEEQVVGYHLEQWYLESSSTINNLEFWYSKIIISEPHHLTYLTLEYFLSQHPIKLNQYSSIDNE